MLNQKIIINRLRLVKYLYNCGINQSKQFEPASSFSILMFHDSIEMYLKLLAEHLGIKSEKFSFIEYWEKIHSLTMKESMINLNARRVNIKHKGLLPSNSDVEISRISVTDFFEQNTFVHFGINFNDITLFALLKNDEISDMLKKAQDYLESKQMENCIETITICFDDLLRSYEKSKLNFFNSSPFHFGKNLSAFGSFQMGLNKNSGDKLTKNLAQFVDNVNESIMSIQKAVKVMSFGIDFKKYAKFKILTPNVSRNLGGTPILEIFGKKKWTEENCQYCIDFVFDCALKLQEFDFDILELVDHQPLTGIGEIE